MSESNLFIPLSDAQPNSDYIMVPLTPSDNQPNPSTDIVFVHNAVTNELHENPPIESKPTTVILLEEDPDNIINSYHIPNEILPASVKRTADSCENDTSTKKLKLLSRSPPHDLILNNVTGNKVRVNSLSYSPLHHTHKKTFSDSNYETATTSQSLRRPGRPLGSTSSSNNHTHTQLVSTPTDEHGFKRGPGRPPKKSFNHATISDASKPKKPRGRPRLSTNKSRNFSTSTPTQNLFEIGSIVWGKIKSCQWWPGMVIAPTVIGKSETPQGCQWVTWYGEFQYSDVLHKNIKPISNFLQFFTPLSFVNANYCEAIFRCIDTAKKRTELYQSKREDSREYDFSAPANFAELLKDGKDKQRELDTLSNLTPEQQNKLSWALKGFPPSGQTGLSIRSEEELSPYAPCLQMLDSGSELDSIEELSVMDVNRYEEGQSFLHSSKNIPQESRAEKDRKNNQMNVQLLREGKIQLRNFCLGCRK